jgi:hypothetical protein
MDLTMQRENLKASVYQESKQNAHNDLYGSEILFSF